MTTSSIGTLPARSPSPVIVVCATDGAGGQRGNRVGHAEPEILVAVDFDRLLQALDDLLHDVADRIRRAPADRVGHRQRVHVAFGGDLVDDVEEPADLGARGVDGEEDGVEAGFLGRERRVDRGLHGPIHAPAVGVLDHVVAGGNLDDHAGAAARLDDLDLFGNAAREREDFGLQPQRGDVLNGGLVLLGHRRHAGLDPVNAERVELLGNRDLLFAAEHDGGLLLAVAQRDVVNLDLRRERIVLPNLGQVTPGAGEPFVGFPGIHLASSISLR